MGTDKTIKPLDRVTLDVRVHVCGNCGPVAQVLHPQWMRRTDIEQMAGILNNIGENLSAHAPKVKLVVTGGGFIEIEYDKRYAPREWRSEGALTEMRQIVQSGMESVAALLSDSRDYVIGVDVRGNLGCSGQFAALLRAGKVLSICWKTYPTCGEATLLAGFGTEMGKHSPRVVSTSLGKTLLLVCHDAQAYSDLRRKASEERRVRAKTAMKELVESEQPEWALSLIHSVSIKRDVTRSFRVSYKRLCDCYGLSDVVGAFGYQKEAVNCLGDLAASSQYPEGNTDVLAILVPAQ